MSSGSKYHFHMGCGEPLQSRWWVTQTRRAILPGSQEVRVERLNKRNSSIRRGTKCKL
jgi:hypothetical protein